MMPLRNECCCPDCGKPLVVEPISETQARFVGCGRNCRKSYDVPEGGILVGAIGAPMFIYSPPEVLEEMSRRVPHFSRSLREVGSIQP
jgi:ssDNA-binding Zn-finger/Zn-ribbon topoisomerase 1